MIQELLGCTVSKIEGAEKASGKIIFRLTDGRVFLMHHYQDCCEYVIVEDVCGDINDLIGFPIVKAEEPSSQDEPAPECADSYTWTFYILGTQKGTVTIRWLGMSSGYYSESVDTGFLNN